MIYPIYVYGSAALRRECKDVEVGAADIKEVVANMFETMYDAEGVGLAAPQIGKSIKLFVVDATAFEDEEPELKDFRKTFINANIYERFGEEWAFTEGCLSIPGIRENVMRPESIKMKYLDENFVEHDETFSGMAARIIQHEYDHISQHVFTDHLSPLRKNLIKNKLTKLTRGDYRTSYRTKLIK